MGKNFENHGLSPVIFQMRNWDLENKLLYLWSHISFKEDHYPSASVLLCFPTIFKPITSSASVYSLGGLELLNIQPVIHIHSSVVVPVGQKWRILFSQQSIEPAENAFQIGWVRRGDT